VSALIAWGRWPQAKRPAGELKRATQLGSSKPKTATVDGMRRIVRRG